MNLSSEIAGVLFPKCVVNASGPLCTTEDELLMLGKSDAGGMITKSCTALPREGNDEPRSAFLPMGAIQCMGLPNPGYHAYIKMIPNLREAFPDKPVIVSVAGLSADDNVKIISEVAQSQPHMIELNLSCPNIPGKPQLAYDFEATESVLSRLPVDASVPIGLKLPPYFDQAHFDCMANIITKYPVVRFITCVNSVGNCLAIDTKTEKCLIRPKDGFGGLSGKYIKPIGLANVRSFRDRLSSDVGIMGVGGIMNGTDAFEYLLAGASVVQLGTLLWQEGPTCFSRIERELSNILHCKGYQSATACVGRLQRLGPVIN